MLRIGERIGDWIVERPLGEGGMGAVYRVHSALTQRLVAALKIMKPSAEPDSRNRFVREAEALASLRHPAVVRVMEFAEDEELGLLYLVMELALGETLRQRLERGPMELRELLGTFLPLAQGLDHAHNAGVFHRDIKPTNIVLCHDGTVRLVDFGIAAARHAEPLTNTGQLGTLAYLPPEVFKGERTEPEGVDVYAFGLLLHEAVTGDRAFPVDPSLTPAAAAAAVGVRKLQAAPVELPDRFPERLRDLVRRATDPDPSRRPSMRDVRATLETLVERRGSGDTTGHVGRLVPLAPVSAPPDEHTMRVPDPTDKPTVARSPRSRRLALAAVLIGGALAGGTALLTHTLDGGPSASADEARRARARAQAATPATAAPALPATAPPATARGTGTASPDPLALPSATDPLAAPTPAPTLAVSPAPTATAAPPASTARPSPPPTRPVPPREAPEEGVPDDDGYGAEPESDSDLPADSGASLGGSWDLTHEIEATSYGPYAGLRLGYRVELQQSGDRVWGRGRKYTENGSLLPPDRRTAISVEGRVEGQYLVLNFVEEGASRSSTGVIRWLLSPGAGALSGRFASDAAQSSGTSMARRVR
jgi:hypothetical protein